MQEPPKPSGRLIGKKKPQPAPDPPPEATPDAAPQVSDYAPPSESDRALEVTQLMDRTDADNSLAWLHGRHTPPQPFRLPQSLGQYEVRGKIAQGGMGMVLRGFHRELKREVAIKLLRAEIAADDDQANTRFMREARATAKLRHPGIVAIHDVGTGEDGTPYLVMDLVQGEDLKAVVDRGPIQPRRAAELLKGVCEAVAHAHAHGILHRDLKPHNVLIDERTGAPLLTDFGLAKSIGRHTKSGNTSRVRPRASLDSDRDVNLTQEGEVMGTPLYMAPEQIDVDARPAGVKTDVYSLGAVLYECLTGSPPFIGETVFDIFHKLLHDRPIPPRQLDADIPADLEAICLRCLEKNPLSRYRSAEEMAKDLGRFLEGTPVLGKVQTSGKPPEPAASWGKPLVMAALALAVVGFFVFAPQELKDRLVRAANALAGNEVEPPTPTTPDGVEPIGMGDGGSDPVAVPTSKLGETRDANLARELPRLRRRAENGDREAMYQLGLFILKNDLTGRPPEAGLEWLEKAHQAGHPDAVRVLAQVHLQGIGVPVDEEAAAQWFRVGVAYGQKRLTVPLVNLLLEQGTSDSYQEAAKLLEPLAKDGDTQAQVTLGDLHRSGFEWTLPERSPELWLAAAESGKPDASKAMLRLAGHHERLLEHDQTFSWLRRAAKEGNAKAMFSLGEAYELGTLNLAQDVKRARKWYARARDHGHPDARARLEALSGRGRG